MAAPIGKLGRASLCGRPALSARPRQPPRRENGALRLEIQAFFLHSNGSLGRLRWGIAPLLIHIKNWSGIVI